PRRRVAPARATTVGPRRPSRLCCGPGPRGSAARGPAALRPGRAARPPGALSPAPARPPGSGRWSHRPYTWRQMAAWGLSGSLPLAVGPAVRPVRRSRAGSRARAVFLDVGASARERAVSHRPYTSRQMAAWGLSWSLPLAVGPAVRPVRRPRAGSWARAVFLDVGASAREEAVVSPSVHLAADGRLAVVLVPATGRGSGCAACSAVPGGLPGTGRGSR